MRTVTRIFMLVFLATAQHGAACDYLHMGLERVAGDEPLTPRKFTLKEIPDIDGDHEPEFLFANSYLCGATGNCPYELLLSQNGCAKFAGEVGGSALLFLTGSHNGAKDLGGYWKGGCTGLEGNWVEYHFDGKQYIKAKSVRCECEQKPDRPKECPPWNHDKPVASSASIPAIFIDTLPFYRKVQVQKSKLSSEKNGPYEVERVVTKSAPANSETVSDFSAKSWARVVLKDLNAKGFVGDDIDWFSGWTGLRPLPDKMTEVTAAQIRTKGVNVGVVRFEVKTGAKFRGEKQVAEVNVVGVLQLDDQNQPLAVKQIFGGLRSGFDMRRILSPKFFADVDGDGMTDIVLLDERYAGASEKVVYITATKELEQPYATKNFPFDSWD